MDRFRHSTAKPAIFDARRCIYCREINTHDLRREHVVPAGIGGGLIIQNASCQRHQKLINEEFERSVLQELLAPIRYIHGIGEVGKKSRKTHLPALVRRGNYFQKQMLPLDQHPDILTLPIFGKPPAILEAKDARPIDITQVRHFHNPEENKRRLRMTRALIKSFSTPITNRDTFVRWLAKVAHGVAVAHHDYAFAPYLLDIIEGNQLEHAGYLIGGPIADIPKPSHAHQHTVMSEIRIIPGLPTLVLVNLQFFAEFGTPVYALVAGKMDEDNAASASE